MGRSFIVYKHTTPSGKVYIGITCQNPSARWKNGFGYRTQEFFWKAIQKYGWDNIKHEILFDSLTKEEAEAKEIELIAEHRSNQKECGYNITRGGEGCAGFVMPEETRIKISESHKKMYVSKESHPRYGKKHSNETKGRMSLSAKKRLKSKENHPMYGKHLTDEQKARISLSHKGLQSGANNPRALTICQYSKDGILIKVFDHIRQAEKELHIQHTDISKCCKGKRKTAGGYIWKYVEKEGAI